MSRGGKIRARKTLSFLAAALCLALPTVAPLSASASQQTLLSEAKQVSVKTKPISRFQIGRDRIAFGPLTFLGGLELISSDRNVGGLSGLLSLDQGSRILAITDNGLWFAASLEQDETGRPLGISNARYTPLLGTKGETLRQSWRHDTEAVTIDGDSLLVSAEQYNGIFRFPWPLTTGKEHMLEELEVSQQIKSLRGSKGLEAMIMAPEGTPLAGTLVAIAERGAEGQSDIPAFLVTDDKYETFSIIRSQRYDVTDAAFLPGGDLLVLERRFNLRDLVGMRMRRFKSSEIKPGARLSGAVLMEADYGYQIDNMEGLAVHENDSGDTIVTLLSDNNRSILQRTLLLRFRLSNH
ncbi:esterase-like activity of phytase family protein [Roseibium sp.]|uniref:esterase-like activity of phytase family protein n=1 Tax=Roseibium sp. TaxID=1936156 RepID=UPI003A973049